MNFEDRIKDIVEDREHGSSVLVERICNAFKSLAQAEDSRERLRWAFGELRRIDSSMVIVHHLLDTLEPHIGTDFFDRLAAYQAHWEGIGEDIARQWMKRRDLSGQTLLAHSHSGTLVAAIAEVGRQVEGLRVLQTRSEPGGEGERQYQQLREQGVTVELIADTEVAERLDEVDAACVGADQFTDEAFVNKVGSAAIVKALAARDKPTYVLVDSRKRVRSLDFSPELFEACDIGPSVHLVTEGKRQRIE